MIHVPRKTARLLLVPLLASGVMLTSCTSDKSDAPDGGSSAPQDSQLSKVVKAKTLRVAVLPDFPPWSVQKPNGKFEGYEIDVAKDLAKAMDVKLKLVSTDGASRLPLLKSDRVDVKHLLLDGNRRAGQGCRLHHPVCRARRRPALSQERSHQELQGPRRQDRLGRPWQHERHDHDQRLPQDEGRAL
jgi:hypothetical protein